MVAAFTEEQAGSLLFLGVDPFSGTARIWNQAQHTLHEGLTGSVLHGPADAEALMPSAVYAMTVDSYRALHPGMPLSTITAQ